MTYRETLTFEQANQLISYNPSTGVFIWKIRDILFFKSERHCKVWNSKYANKIAGSINDCGYIQICFFKKPILAHRLAFLLMTGKYPKDRVDHIDENKTNNCWSNLREANHSQNLANTGLWRHNTSGHKGVTWDKSRGKWQAKIKINGKMVHLGRFDNIEDAAYVCKKKYEEVYGEFSYSGK